MHFNFELTLFCAVIISGVIALYDVLFLAKKRKILEGSISVNGKRKLPIVIEYARSFFPVLLLVFVLRSFLYEPFRIPSGSLVPTLLIGDFIAVNKYYYGIRLPIIHTKVYSLHEPKRGDIIIFRWPPNPTYNFIKRVIGEPGDRISYINKTLYINGEKIPQEYAQDTTDRDDEGHIWNVEEKIENIFGIKHAIYLNVVRINEDIKDIIVPDDMYFVMGDNRDNSADSRIWGFVPEKNIVGKANYVWMSWDANDHTIRWKRLGTKII